MIDLQEIIDFQSLAKKKAAAMGFIYKGSTITVDGTIVTINGKFECVCKNIETYTFRIDLSQVLDPASLLDAHGAFSEEHLEEDGYSPEDIEIILQKGRAFDENHKLSK